MSTGLECEFLWLQANGKPDGEWFYILEEWDAPKNSWDWHEYATAFGPFPTEDAAQEHLRANHANPGGRSVSQRQEAPASLSRTTQDLLDSARADLFAAAGGTASRIAFW